MAAPRYQVLERIDAGGMAEVFKGKVSTVQGIEKLVAIKRVLPGLTENDKFVRMFLDEARVAMQLSHANIVHVYDIGKTPDTGDTAGAFFIVMEYVEGLNLKSVVERNLRTGRRLPLAVSLYIMTEVCKALSYAHTLRDLQGHPLGIVHRDVSPPNILMSRAGEVKLADFGLAKAHSQVEATDPGIVKGKFSYLSPEAAYGETVDLRSDVFSLGIIVWELIAGRRLFYGDTDMDTLHLVRKCLVPPLAGLHAEVGPELSSIILKALARDTADRYQSARELGDALIRYLFANGLAVSSQDVSALVDEFLGGSLSTPVPQPTAPAAPPAIDRLIQDEIAHFTSLPGVRGRPAPQPEEYDGSEPLDFDEGGEVVTQADAQVPLVDPRTWDLDGMADLVQSRGAKTPAGAPKAAPRAASGPSRTVTAPVQAGQGATDPNLGVPADLPPVSSVPLWIVVLLLSVVTFLSVSAMYLWMADSLAH